MTRDKRGSPALLGALLLTVVVGLTGCSSSPEAASTTSPAAEAAAQVEHPAGGSAVSRITLSESAAVRLGITTEAIRATDRSGPGRSTMPYSALLYDGEGRTWVYANPEPLTYERAPIEVVSIADDRVLLARGPAVGTEVVTVGAAELLGEELDVGH